MSDAGAIGHGTLMDRVYARQRHIYDATRKYFLLGRDRLIAELDAPDGARILEIGCGTGRNLVKIARRYPQARCFGVDISQAMLETADASVARAALGARVGLAQGDAATFDAGALFGVAAFDRIVVSYALSMIPAWRDVLRHAASLLAPGGSLHVVDFGDQAGLPTAFKRLLGAWLRRFHVTPRENLALDVDDVARAQGLVSSTTFLYRGYAVTARLERPR